MDTPPLVNPARASNLRRLLAERSIAPSKRLGQNFLVDGNIVRILADAAAVTRDDAVLEIGPGAGALTGALLERAGRVVAVEKDARLCDWLRERFAAERGLTLVQADALDVDLAALAADGCRVMASNLPYSAGTRILMKIFGAAPRPERMVVTLQTEVAERLAAAPGSRAYGLVSVHAQRLYDIEFVRRIPGSCFYPAPDVESSAIRLALRRQPRAEPRSIARFNTLVKGAFMRRRKQIQRALHDMGWMLPDAADSFAWLRAAGVDPAARSETLTVEQWGALADAADAWGAPPPGESAACD